MLAPDQIKQDKARMKTKPNPLNQPRPAKFNPLMSLEEALTVEAAAAMQGIPPQQFMKDAAVQHALAVLECEAGARLDRQLALA